jgi:TorA maturation chaperone TorD
LESKKLYHEPDDHIALELEFVAHLTALALQASQNDEMDSYTDLLKARQDFLSQHLLQWCFDWCTKVDENAEGLFYKGISNLIRGAMYALAETD